jgi:transcriptional regulator with XRE-family HTH domain
MPKVSTLKLPPLNLGKETLGQRIARLRKEKGYTQVKLAELIGITQDLISSYESDRLGMKAEMVIRFARALAVTTDELLGVKPAKPQADQPSLKLIRRLHKIQSLPPAQQKALLKTIDMYIKAAEK